MTVYQRKLQLEQRKVALKNVGFYLATTFEYIAVWAVYMVIITKMLRII